MFDPQMMQQWLPWITAMGQSLQAGARSYDPRAGDLGYVWGSGMEGYGKGALLGQEMEQRKRYNELMNRHYETQAGELALRKQQATDKALAAQQTQALIKAMYGGGGAPGQPQPMRVEYNPDETVTGIEMPKYLEKPAPQDPMSSVQRYPDTLSAAMAASDEDQMRQDEENTLSKYIKGRTGSFQAALSNLAALDPEAAARYAVMWEMGHLKPYNQVVGYDSNGLPQVQQVMIDPVKGSLVPLGPQTTRTTNAPYWAQPGVVPPPVQQRGFQRDAGEIPNAKAPPAPPREREQTPAQKASEAGIRKQREIIRGSWGKLPFDQLTEDQRKQLEKAYGTRLGEEDPENDEYLQKMAKNQETRRRQARIRYYQNMLQMAPESQKQQIREQAKKEGIQL